MAEPILSLFDVKHLVGKLNGSLAKGQGEIQLGEFVDTTPEFKGLRTPVRYFWMRARDTVLGHQTETEGYFPLTLYTIHPSSFRALPPIERRQSIGRVSVESRACQINGEEHGHYEGLSLRLRKRVRLSERVIPSCRVDYTRETQAEGGVIDTRHTFVDQGGIMFFAERTITGRVKDDLGNKVVLDLLPDSWFTGDNSVSTDASYAAV